MSKEQGQKHIETIQDIADWFRENLPEVNAQVHDATQKEGVFFIRIRNTIQFDVTPGRTAEEMTRLAQDSIHKLIGELTMLASILQHQRRKDLQHGKETTIATPEIAGG